MTKFNVLTTIAIVSTLISCSGSDQYRGTWKATDTKGNKYEITFQEKSFDVKDSLGTSNNYDYTQHSVEIQNGTKTYGIKLSDGRGYKIQFPNSENMNIGFILDENGAGVYTIGKSDYVQYEDIYKL